MAFHIDLGKKGEQLAEAFLVNRGYTILQRNWRFSHFEIDLITRKDDLLHFVEVKCRSNELFAHPEESVSKKKLKSLFQAIEQYLHLHRQYVDFRLDILSVVIRENSEPEYFFIEDVTC